MALGSVPEHLCLRLLDALHVRHLELVHFVGHLECDPPLLNAEHLTFLFKLQQVISAVEAVEQQEFEHLWLRVDFAQHQFQVD